MKRHPRTCIPNLFHGKEKLEYVNKQTYFPKGNAKGRGKFITYNCSGLKKTVCATFNVTGHFFSICGLKIKEKCIELILPNVTYFIVRILIAMWGNL